MTALTSPQIHHPFFSSTSSSSTASTSSPSKQQQQQLPPQPQQNTMTSSATTPPSRKRSPEDAEMEDTITVSDDTKVSSSTTDTGMTNNSSSNGAANANNTNNDNNAATTSTTTMTTTTSDTNSSTEPPKKKAKLSAEEKQAREKEKEEKRKEKEAKEEEKRKEKEKKDKERADEKAAKELEKAEKEKERLEKKKKNDDAKKIKDDEKKKKDEAAAKKDRAQMRLEGFFRKPAGATTSPKQGYAISEGDGASTSRATSAKPDEPMDDQPAADKENKPSDYRKTFHNFFVKPNTVVAELNQFKSKINVFDVVRLEMDKIGLSDSGEEYDNADDEGDGDKMDIDSSKKSPSKRKKRRHQVPRPIPKGYFIDHFNIPQNRRGKRGIKQIYTTQQILSALNSSPNPIFDDADNLTNNKGNPDYESHLRALRMKHLSFHEDVRPAYRGTYTRVPTSQSLLQGRNPFSKSLPNVNYDYDSEAEWVDIPGEEGEGEELLSEEDDDDGSNSSGDDMEEFLDDEVQEEEGQQVLGIAGAAAAAAAAAGGNGGGVVSKKGIVGPLLPQSTGLIWEDEQKDMRKWEPFRIGILLENVDAPIDPFSTVYWETPKAALARKAAGHAANAITNYIGGGSGGSDPTNMGPPKGPLLGKGESNTSKKAKTAARVPDEDMEEFKKAIDGNNLTKAGLIEVLKKQFPKHSKDVIRETLSEVAIRVGAKEQDKRWKLV